MGGPSSRQLKCPAGEQVVGAAHVWGEGAVAVLDGVAAVVAAQGLGVGAASQVCGPLDDELAGSAVPGALLVAAACCSPNCAVDPESEAIHRSGLLS